MGSAARLDWVKSPPDVTTFDRHLLREWLQILGMVLAVTCGLLVVQVCYDSLRSLREAGARGWELWTYIFVTMPSFFATVLPFALLVSLLFILTKLHRANEITAMRAAGVGILRLTAPVWLIGVLCCGLTWWLNSSLVPWSVEKSQAMEEAIDFRSQARTLSPDRIGAVYGVAFEEPAAGRIWFLNRYSQATGRAYGVTVSVLDAQRRETERIDAAEGWPDRERGGWVLAGGRVMDFNTDTGEQLSSDPFRQRWFPGLAADPRLMLLTGSRPIDLSFYELRRVVRYYAAENAAKGVPFAVRYYMLIADTLAPLIVIAIAIPFSVTGVRVNPAVGVSKSIGLFMAYFVLENLAASVATKGWLDPQLAAWLPDAGLAAAALWFFSLLR